MHMQALTAHRELFMTEQVILQYIGFVNTHMNIIRKRTHAGKPKEGKIFYHVSAFHGIIHSTMPRFSCILNRDVCIMLCLGY